MATFKQNTVENTDYSAMAGTESGFGKRDDKVLKAAFKASPLYTDKTYNNEAAVEDLGEEVLQGEFNKLKFTDNFGNIIASSTYYSTVSDINLNYVNAADGKSLNDVANNNGKTTEAGEFGTGKGAPETPYTPPLTSPGAGNFEAGGQDGLGLKAGDRIHEHTAFGSGEGHANPSVQTIGTQTIGSYTKGES
jgi:hypothetical protein